MSTRAGVLALLAMAAAHEVAIGYNAMTTDIQEKTIQEKSDQKFYDQIEASLESIAEQLNQLYASKVTAMKKISRLEAKLGHAAHADHVGQLGRWNCDQSFSKPISFFNPLRSSCKCGPEKECKEKQYCYVPDGSKITQCHDTPQWCFKVENKLCPAGFNKDAKKTASEVKELVTAAVLKLKNDANGENDPCVKYITTPEGDGWSVTEYHASFASFEKHRLGFWVPFTKVPNGRNARCAPAATGAKMTGSSHRSSSCDNGSIEAQCWFVENEKEKGNRVDCPDAD